MPTARPRHQVTETDDLARLLDLAARRWPDESRGRLLVRVLELGGAALKRELGQADSARVRAVDATAGKYGAVFEVDHLAALREDWPE